MIGPQAKPGGLTFRYSLGLRPDPHLSASREIVRNFDTEISWLWKIKIFWTLEGQIYGGEFPLRIISACPRPGCLPNKLFVYCRGRGRDPGRPSSRRDLKGENSRSPSKPVFGLDGQGLREHPWPVCLSACLVSFVRPVVRLFVCLFILCFLFVCVGCLSVCLSVCLFVCLIAWLGLAWLGLAWLGLAWLGLASFVCLFVRSFVRLFVVCVFCLFIGRSFGFVCVLFVWLSVKPPKSRHMSSKHVLLRTLEI